MHQTAQFVLRADFSLCASEFPITAEYGQRIIEGRKPSSGEKELQSQLAQGHEEGGAVKADIPPCLPMLNEEATQLEGRLVCLLMCPE